MKEYDKDQIESALRIDFDSWNERMLKELLGVAYRECQLLQSRLESLEKENASLKQGAVRLHNEIMNLRVNEDSAVAPYTNCREAYLWGNRDARHAAAELVVVMRASAQ